MNKKLVRFLLTLTLGIGCASWGFAQEDDATPKKPLPKSVQNAKAKAAARKAAARTKAEAEQKAKAVDINRASKAELKKVPGITDAYADAIIANRPYRTKADLVTKNVLPLGTYQSLRKQIAAK